MFSYLTVTFAAMKLDIKSLREYLLLKTFLLLEECASGEREAPRQRGAPSTPTTGKERPWPRAAAHAPARPPHMLPQRPTPCVNSAGRRALGHAGLSEPVSMCVCGGVSEWEADRFEQTALPGEGGGHAVPQAWKEWKGTNWIHGACPMAGTSVLLAHRAGISTIWSPKSPPCG